MEDSARIRSTDRGAWLAPAAFMLLTAVLLSTLATAGYLYYTAHSARSQAQLAVMEKRWAESERDILEQELTETKKQLTAARTQLQQTQERIRTLVEERQKSFPEQPGQQSRPRADSVATAQLAREAAGVATTLDQCLAAHRQLAWRVDPVLGPDMVRLLRQIGDACRQARQSADRLRQAVLQSSPATLPVHEATIPGLSPHP